MNIVIDVIALLALFAVGAQAGGITLGDAGADKVSADKAAEAVSDSIRDLFGLPTEPVLEPKPAVVPEIRKTSASTIAKAAATKPKLLETHSRRRKHTARDDIWLSDFDPVHKPRKAQVLVPVPKTQELHEPRTVAVKADATKERTAQDQHREQQDTVIFARPHPSLLVQMQSPNHVETLEARVADLVKMKKTLSKEAEQSVAIKTTKVLPSPLSKPVALESRMPAAPPPTLHQLVQKQSPIFAHTVTKAEQDAAILFVEQQDDASPVAATVKGDESVVMTMTLVPTEKTPLQSTKFNTGFGSSSWLGERIASSTQPWLGERIRSTLSHFFGADSAIPADTATSQGLPLSGPHMSDISAPHPHSDKDLYGGGLYVPRDLKLAQSSKKVISGQSLVQTSKQDTSGKSTKQDFDGTADATVADGLAQMDIHDEWVAQEQEDNEAVESVKRDDRALRLAAAIKQKPVLPFGGVDTKGSTHISGFWEKLRLQDQAMIKSLDQGGEDITQYSQMLQLQNARVEAAVGDTERRKTRLRNAGDV